jgi:4'-phosphopantetheinyl transferase
MTPASEELIAGFGTPIDREAVLRHRLPHRRRQSLAGRALLRQLLEAEAGIPRERCCIVPDRNGKPAVRLGGTQQMPYVSISHSRDRVACAITAFGSVGVDVEYCATERAADRIAAATFGPHERRTVEAAGAMAFYRLWTLREATAKALGRGVLELEGEHDYFAAEMPEGTWRSRLWQQDWAFGHGVVPGDYSLALALLLPAGPDSTVAWELFCRGWRQLAVPP